MTGDFKTWVSQAPKKSYVLKVQPKDEPEIPAKVITQEDIIQAETQETPI